MGIIVFAGGPLDGQAYETRDLLGAPSLNLPDIHRYKWTSEKRTSERTGAVAQVWRYDVPTPPQQTPGAVAPPPQEPAAPATVPVVVTGPAEARDSIQTTDTVTATLTGPVEIISASVGSDPAAAGPGTSFVVSGSVEDVNYDNLLERRKALKVSRGEVSTRCGLAQSKIDTIENNKPGKRVTDEERRTLAACIAQLEQERAASAH